MNCEILAKAENPRPQSSAPQTRSRAAAAGKLPQKSARRAGNAALCGLQNRNGIYKSAFSIMRPDAVGDIRIKALLRPDRLRRKSHGAAPNFSLWRNYLPKAACKTHCRLKKSPLFSTLLPNGRKKKPRSPAGCQNYMVVGTGFEPVNGKAERIYSPRPLAPWIPYHRVNWDLNIHSAIFGTSFFFNFFRFSARLRTRQNADFRRARAAETLLKPLARHHKPPVARGDYQPPAPKFRSVRISGYFFNPHRLRVFLVF